MYFQNILIFNKGFFQFENLVATGYFTGQTLEAIRATVGSERRDSYKILESFQAMYRFSRGLNVCFNKKLDQRGRGGRGEGGRGRGERERERESERGRRGDLRADQKVCWKTCIGITDPFEYVTICITYLLCTIRIRLDRMRLHAGCDENIGI